MGALLPPAPPARPACNAVATYVHRLLHLLGLSAVDAEELSLISAPLVRIHAASLSRVLAHHPHPLHPDEPFGFLPTSPAPPLAASAFFLHFDTSNPAVPDRARLATAAAPRAWLAVHPKTGLLSLTVSKLHSAVFLLRPTSSRAHHTDITLSCPCTAGRFLSAHSNTLRARVSADTPGPPETLRLNALPLPPTLAPPLPARPPPQDCAMAAALRATRCVPVRIQSVARAWFLASKPGAPLAASLGKDTGWDAFTLEYDSTTRTAKIRDARGMHLAFSPALDEVVARPDGEVPRPENFAVLTEDAGDRVMFRSRKGYLSARRGGRVVLSKDTVPGRREQFHLRLALPSMMDQSKPRLRLRTMPGGARQTEASVLVPAPARIAYEVLCDYDGFCNFIRDASESRVLERRSATELSVLMVQCHSFLMLTIPMTMALRVKEDPEARVVRMDLERGLGVKQYNGVWSAEERPDGRCLIRCTLLALSAVPAPGFLVDGLMSHATMSTMEQLRVECIRRSSAEGPRSPRRQGTVAPVEALAGARGGIEALSV